MSFGSIFPAPDASRAAWRPDLGDGAYKNPVLNADYSDPDVICAGDDYWMTASSFNHVPGLPVLHSRDLVNWALVNHALPLLVPRGHFSSVHPGHGVWAPSLRHHAGKFWIYYPDPDFGLYAITASDPRGKWSAPVLVKGGKGLIDPCPLWDDDGQVYLAHGWAKSRSGICNRLTLHRLAPDGLETMDEGRVIINADSLPGWNWLEGPKLYKRNGWYYIFAPAGGVESGWQAVFRSHLPDGPYEHRIVLEQGGSPINGPHQGAWIETPAGEHWFLHFQKYQQSLKSDFQIHSSFIHFILKKN
jgi:beta-xylosidase